MRLPSFIIAGALLAAPALADAPAPVDARALTVEQAPLVMATPLPAGPRIQVEARLSRPDGRYLLNETIVVTATVDRPSYVTALNVAPDGAVTVLFPNQFNQDNRAFPGQTVVIPGAGAQIRVTPPVGRELIKVIASERPIPLATLADFRQVGPFVTSVPGAAALVARTLTVEAAPAPTPQPALPAVGVWGETTLAIETAAPGAPVPAVFVAPAPVPPGLTFTVGKPVYRVGEPLGFVVASDQACYLTLLHLSASGRASVLFPFAPEGPRLIPAGAPVRIPADVTPALMVAQGPAGMDTVVALCATDDRPVVATAEALSAVRVEVIQNGGFSPRALALVYGASATPTAAQASVTFQVVE